MELKITIDKINVYWLPRTWVKKYLITHTMSGMISRQRPSLNVFILLTQCAWFSFRSSELIGLRLMIDVLNKEALQNNCSNFASPVHLSSVTHIDDCSRNRMQIGVGGKKTQPLAFFVVKCILASMSKTIWLMLDGGAPCLFQGAIFVASQYSFSSTSFSYLMKKQKKSFKKYARLFFGRSGIFMIYSLAHLFLTI